MPPTVRGQKLLIVFSCVHRPAAGSAGTPSAASSTPAAATSTSATTNTSAAATTGTTSTLNENPEQQRRQTRDLLVAFARRRPDLLYALPSASLTQVIELGLIPRSHRDKHLSNAFKRLQHSFGPAQMSEQHSVGSQVQPTATAAGGAGGGGGALRPTGFDTTVAQTSSARSAQASGPVSASSSGRGPPLGRASLQDLMRVLHDWASHSEGQVSSAAPGEHCTF